MRGPRPEPRGAAVGGRDLAADLQAALRGKRVRPRTAFKLAQALHQFPVLAEITELLDAS